MKKLGFIFALFTLAVLPCLAADSPFAGTWKLDTAKSKFTGDTFTYTATPSGGMHYANGPIEYDFSIDGKPYPTVADRTTTWTKVDDHNWDIVNKAGDTVIAKSHRALSPDGNTLVLTFKQLRPDGSTGDGSITYTRVSGGPGLAGTWKDVKANIPGGTVAIKVPAAGQIDYEILEFQVAIVGPTDGTPIVVKGPRVPEGFVATYKAVGPDKFEYSNKLNDKVLLIGVLSSDGKTLTDTSWAPGKENEKAIAVYDKQ